VDRICYAISPEYHFIAADFYRELTPSDLPLLIESFCEGLTRARLLSNLGDPVGSANMSRATESVRRIINELISEAFEPQAHEHNVAAD
jgi:hypothetical protein